MSMEMNKLWKAADFKALAVRLTFASGMINHSADEAQLKQQEFVANAARRFLAEYEKNQ